LHSPLSTDARPDHNDLGYEDTDPYGYGGKISSFGGKTLEQSQSDVSPFFVVGLSVSFLIGFFLDLGYEDAAPDGNGDQDPGRYNGS
jgi:hypothetical protein